jgi:hypothetical protein
MDDMLVSDLAKRLRGGSTRRNALRGLAAGTIAGIAGATGLDAANQGKSRRRKQRRETRPRQVRRESELSFAALKVMTRNLYLGADLAPIFQAQNAQQVVVAATRIFAMVQATNFPERAKAMAAEIAAADPLLVGLQEVTRWRSQTPADFRPQPNAEDTEYDFLAILLRELRARDRHYEPVVSVRNSDAEAPRATPTGHQDIRLTDHDVLLARPDLPERVFSVANPQSANFADALTIPNPVIGDITIRRGWVAADVTLQGQTARVVNTHLEPSHPGIQVAQAEELLAGPMDTPLPVVLIGDLNSAAGGVGSPSPSDPPTYDNLIAAGFTDAWTATRGDRAGETWGHDEDLRNPEPHLSVRIDFILTRGDIAASTANLVGEKPSDRTPSGLWPSDHAGVWAVLHFRES